MSTWFEELVPCPACGREVRAKLAYGAHVARAPEVRAQVLERSFHRATCACGEVFRARRGVVYTDVDRRQWIQVSLEEERPIWPELEVATGALFERAFTGAPAAAELAEGMRVRLVFGYEELREKLVVWAAALDDAVVECLKLRAIERDPSLAATPLVVERVTGGALVFEPAGREPFTIPAAAVDAAHADMRLPPRFPELFGGRYVALHRLLGPRYRPAPDPPR
ncbi:MAG: hypothetical protein KIT31_29570 [Deltaproteobacteria bacterium]|nr:hypothetical protein [Deltaproteobacteria bacterium]